MVDIVTRAEWGARSPDGVTRIATPTPRLWVHHTAGSERGAAGMRSIQAYHMDTKGWRDIAYSFVVDVDGTVYEGRGAGVAGGHTEGDNSSSHAICVMGNYENVHPTTAALASVVALARHGRDRRWWVPTLGGHRDAPGATTACPGRHLYARLPDIRSAVAVTEPPQEDDMPTLDEIRKVVREELERDNATAVALLVKGDGRGVSAGLAARWYAVGALGKRHITSREEAYHLIVAGQLKAAPGNVPFVWAQAVVDAIDDVAVTPTAAAGS